MKYEEKRRAASIRDKFIRERGAGYEPLEDWENCPVRALIERMNQSDKLRLKSREPAKRESEVEGTEWGPVSEDL